MNAILKYAAAVVAGLVLNISPAWAVSASDLWWNQNESGWGVNVVQQGTILFLTFYVYDQNGNPLWLVAPSTQRQSVGADNSVTYSGPLYQTKGPWLGGPFNPSSVSATQVGTATFHQLTQTTATLDYSVNGTSVSKSLTGKPGRSIRSSRATTWAP